jgi:hypothetical protein
MSERIREKLNILAEAIEKTPTKALAMLMEAEFVTPIPQTAAAYPF